MTKLKIGGLAIALGLFSGVASAQLSTTFTAVGETIGQVDVIENGNVLVIDANGGGWGAPGCPTAFFVQLTPALTGYSEMLATILTARAAELPVRFSGTCRASNAAFFDVDRVRLQ